MKAKRIPNKHVNGKGGGGHPNYESDLFVVEHWKLSDIPVTESNLFTPTTEDHQKLVTKLIYVNTDWIDKGFDDEDNAIYFNSHLAFNNDAEIIKLLKPSEIL